MDASARAVVSQAGCTDTSPVASIGSLYRQRDFYRDKVPALVRALGLPPLADPYKSLRTFKPATREQHALAVQLATILDNLTGIVGRICTATEVNLGGGNARRVRDRTRKLALGRSNIDDLPKNVITPLRRREFFALAPAPGLGDPADGTYRGYVENVTPARSRGPSVFAMACVLMEDANGAIPPCWRAVAYLPRQPQVPKRTLCEFTVVRGRVWRVVPLGGDRAPIYVEAQA